jgi:hypothetical protein
LESQRNSPKNSKREARREGAFHCRVLGRSRQHVNIQELTTFSHTFSHIFRDWVKKVEEDYLAALDLAGATVLLLVVGTNHY